MGGMLARLAPMAWGSLTMPLRELLRMEAERRRAIRAFTAGGGLELTGGPKQQEWFMNRIREAMLRSRSFEALMNEIRNDSAHPIKVGLSNKAPDVFVDGFYSNLTLGSQELDLDDLNHLPTDPLPDHPNAITRGEVLAHAMAEARQGALGIEGDRGEYEAAHDKAIDAQNAYRDDLGQKGHRRHHPDDGGFNAAGNFEMRYDNGYSEIWVKGDAPRSIDKVVRSSPTQTGSSYDAADDLKKSMEGTR